jgi:outer membrane protein TolC
MRRTFTIVFIFLVIVPGMWAQENASPLSLTLRDAIALAMKSNLGVLVAGTQVAEAGGTAERRRSALLPRVTADHVTSLQNRNLRAFGISLPGFPLPTVVGPFSNYDYRLFASQTILDRQATHTMRASERQEQAERLSYQDVRDQVVRQSAGLYLDAQTAAAEVEAAEARLAVSKALAKLAQDQRGNGLATGVDVIRAQVQVQRDQQNVLVAQNSYQTSLLVLQRFLGLRPGMAIELKDPLVFHPVSLPNVDEAFRNALSARADYRSLCTQRDALNEQQKASRARYLPRLTADGNYGLLGRSYGTMPGIGAIEATVAITIFDRDRNGEQKEIASRIDRINDQIADLEHGIEQELRKAILDLDSAEQQVTVTQAGLDLAQRELELSRDRFKNGLNDNIEIVTAQSSLQAAQDDHILALARHEDATMALIRAMGATEQIYQNYLVDSAATPQPKNSGKEVPRP